MGLFDLSRRVAAKKFDDAARAHAPQLNRVDTGLPLNAQIGALLELPRADFALLDRSLLVTPAAAQIPIVAVSRIHLDADDSLALYRLYTNVGIDRSGAGASYLQILCRDGQPGEIRDVAYYQFLCRQYPVTDEDQAPFRGEGFGMGEIDYSMAEDQLQDIPHAAHSIDALLGEDDALHFTRDSPGGSYVAPYTARENRLDDAVGEKGVTKQLSFMPYVRDLPNQKQERLLISFDYVESMDGRSAPTVYVDFMAGLSLEPNKIRVL